MTWADYLDERLHLVNEFDLEGRTSEEIYDILSVDPGQVNLLIMTAREQRAAGKLLPDVIVESKLRKWAKYEMATRIATAKREAFLEVAKMACERASARQPAKYAGTRKWADDYVRALWNLAEELEARAKDLGPDVEES